MAEFLLLRQQQSGPTVWVVEAKSSSPRPETQPDFTAFIDEIRRKLTHGFRFVLVINGYKQEWLAPL